MKKHNESQKKQRTQVSQINDAKKHRLINRKISEETLRKKKEAAKGLSGETYKESQRKENKECQTKYIESQMKQRRKQQKKQMKHIKSRC